MGRFGRAGTTGAAVGALFLLAAGGLGGQERFEWTGELAPGREIRVEGILGTIRAVASPTGRGAVRAVLSGPGAERGEVRVEAVEHGDGVTVCALYPSRRGRTDNVCSADRGGRNWNVDEAEVRVDFEVEVPGGVSFVAQTISGRIIATGLDGPVHAATVNGDVEVTTSGPASATSVSGDLDVTLGRLDPEGAAFSTVSGDMVIRVSGELHADIRFRTLSGDIWSDFPMNLTRGGRRVEGTVGHGGPLMQFQSVSGDVELRRLGG